MPNLAVGFEFPITVYQSLGWSFANESILTATPHRSSGGEGGSQYLDAAFGFQQTPSMPGVNNQYVHSAVRWASNGTTLDWRWYTSDGSIQITIRMIFGGAQQIEVYRGNFSTLLANISSSGLNTINWHLLEFDVVIHPTTGRVRIWRDRGGTPLIDFTGNTRHSGTSNDWAYMSADCVGSRFQFDDWIILSSSEGRATSEWFGQGLSPDGNGSTIQLSPSTGSNYQTVDESSPADTDYNEASAAGQYDLYNVTTLLWTPTNILCLVAHARTARDGTITQSRTRIYSGGVDGLGTYQALGASGVYAHVDDIFNTDPNGGGAWTSAAIASLQIGVQFN